MFSVLAAVHDILVACRTSCCRDAFTKLDEEQRRGILEPPVREISRMLEQNLFHKFRETPGMRRQLEQQRREKLGTRSLREKCVRSILPAAATCCCFAC